MSEIGMCTTYSRPVRTSQIPSRSVPRFFVSFNDLLLVVYAAYFLLSCIFNRTSENCPFGMNAIRPGRQLDRSFELEAYHLSATFLVRALHGAARHARRQPPCP